jgi:hypothetical protein
MDIEKLDTITAAKIYLLLTMLNGTMYAIAELEPEKMRGHTKLKFQNLRTVVRNFMTSISKQATAKDKDVLNEYTFGNVGLMAEVFAILSHVPESQMEWITKEIQSLTIQSINNLEDEDKSGDI